MLDRADVFVQNLAPGAAERAGFGATALRADNPRLIVCEITGYGDSGPYAEMKAYDFLIQCETGLASITGGPESPGRVGVSVADIGCGMNAHAAILQALYARERTGDGRPDLRVPVRRHRRLDGRATDPSRIYGARARSGSVSITRRSRPMAPMPRAMGRSSSFPFRLKPNGRASAASCSHGPTWSTTPNSRPTAGEPRNRDALDAEMGAAFAHFDAAGMGDALRRANIAFGRYNTVGEFAHHSQLRRAEVQTPSGPVSVPAPPQVFDAKPIALGPFPSIGEHSETIRREFASET